MKLRYLLVSIAALAAMIATACGSDSAETITTGAEPPASGDAQAHVEADIGHGYEIGTYLTNPGDFAGKKAADWDNAEKVRVEMNEFSFTPNDLVFETGKPYIVELANVGQVKHEFTAEDFFASVAWRKVESAQNEIKGPYFNEIEVFAGEAVELYFVPVQTGTFGLVCEIPGHFEAGMHGTITVVGDPVTSPEPVYASIQDAPWVTNGSEIVAAARAAEKEWTEINIDLGEFYFSPDEIHLKVDQPYKIVFDNVGAVKHEATAGIFFQTVAFRKVEDGSGEFKTPAPAEIEVFAGAKAELFLIPTQAGDFGLVCEIPGHLEAGMHGHFIVDET